MLCFVVLLVFLMVVVVGVSPAAASAAAAVIVFTSACWNTTFFPLPYGVLLVVCEGVHASNARCVDPQSTLLSKAGMRGLGCRRRL